MGIEEVFRETILREAVVGDLGNCHLAYSRLNLPPRRGVDLATGRSIGESCLEYPRSAYSWFAERECWVIRYGLVNGCALKGCDCTHALTEEQAICSWNKLLADRGVL